MKRGDLSGPVLAILVTLVLLAIGAAVIAYFTLFTGGASQPVLSISGQPVAYKSSKNAVVEITVANVGSAPVTLDPEKTNLTIVSPITNSTSLRGRKPILGPLPPEREPLPSPTTSPTTPLPPITIAPGSTATLKFNFTNLWGDLEEYRIARGVLQLVDTAGNTVGVFEVNIRIVGGG